MDTRLMYELFLRNRIHGLAALTLYVTSFQFHTGTVTITPMFHVPANRLWNPLYTLGLVVIYPPVSITLGRCPAFATLTICLLMSTAFCRTLSSGLAATEVEGVASMAGNITNELVGKLGMKNLSKGVKVDVLEGVVCVDLSLNLSYGFSIPQTCKKVQEKVKAAIENMTGLQVSDVNISIASVELEEVK